jgi:hydrophobic/amphiphilic exporter-1 (mainly G- bacteria), HAE1 family
VAYRRGAPVRLEQIANVIDSVEDTQRTAWFYTRESGKLARSMTVSAMRQPGSNLVEVSDALRRLMPVVLSQLPPSIYLTFRGDLSTNIRKSFRDIQWTMLLTLVLVVAVIFVFLHNGSATAIPALALPFSVLGTFAVMKLLHFTLDNLSMMALILSIGFIVDDAIVMLENIVHHMQQGEDAHTAALSGSKEIGFTILTMTASLAAVFMQSVHKDATARSARRATRDLPVCRARWDQRVPLARKAMRVRRAPPALSARRARSDRPVRDSRFAASGMATHSTSRTMS